MNMATRYARRLSRMSWHEVQTRTRQKFTRHADVWLHRFGMASFCATETSRAHILRGNFFCAEDSIPGILSILTDGAPQDREAILVEADTVLRRRFRLL